MQKQTGGSRLHVGYDRATKALPKADLEHNAEFKKFAATQLLAS